MTEEPNVDSPPVHSKQGFGCMNACAVITVIIPALYLLISLLNLSWSLFNQLRWNLAGSPNYTITVQNDALPLLCPDAGTWRLPVRDGKVTAGYEELAQYTINNLFAKTRECAFPVPFQSCDIEYDGNHGYPTRVITSRSYPISFATEANLTCFRVRVVAVHMDSD